MAYRNYADFKERKPTRQWHEALVDDMLANPTAKLEDRSARLNRSVNYLSMIINTDMFKALYEARRQAFTERLEGSIANKTAQVADRALDMVLETLEKKRDSLPFQSLVELTDRTLTRLGYGVAKPGPAVNVNVVQSGPMVSAAQLAEARAAALDRARDFGSASARSASPRPA
jgi:hypothetical protein